MREHFDQGVRHLVVLGASQGMDPATVFPGSRREQQEVTECSDSHFSIGGLCSRSHSTQGGDGALQVPQKLHGLERERPKEVQQEPKCE